MVGEASHICAAAEGGPRYDPGMSTEERRSAKNGIWMCKDHGTSVDSYDPKFTVELLREWKAQAERDSHRRVLYNDVETAAKVSDDELAKRLRDAAAADIEAFKLSEKWPSTAVALTVEMKELDKPVPTTALARAVHELGDLILIAPPGMGKTSTLLQVAEGIVEHGETPIFIPLADWATEDIPLLDSVLRRAPFRGRVTENDFRAVAKKPGVFLLLDGWNELDSRAQRRARVELKRLQIDFPEIGLFISTRRQFLNVPFEGAAVDLLPLSEAQQMQIASALGGEEGARIVDQAWRTPGVRDLVTIPLYLTTLLSLPAGQPFPKTKEEILRRFVEAHERQPAHAEPLREAAKGFQSAFLGGLAVTATHAANTSISDTNAQRSIATTDDLLLKDGQLTIVLQPTDVLEALVNHHVLVREPAGFRFQHQQFQEWFASHEVERAMLVAVGDADAREKLKKDVLNAPSWEEPTLFAVERMSRGDDRHRTACAAAILSAFEVDPMLAADMIFRATDEVWAEVSETILALVNRWHEPGKLDRAVRFMITSGRSEFRDLIWPLITNENEQKSLPALRAARRFRTSVLGANAATDILALPIKARTTIVAEIGYNSGIDGLELATAIAKADSDPEVKAAAVGGMSFRRADRHVADVLSTAGDETYDLVHRKHHLDQIDNAAVQQGLAAARARAGIELTDYERLRSAVYATDGADHSDELTELIGTMHIERKRDGEAGLIYEARKNYSSAVARGLLKRLREGRELFYGADNILAASGMVFDDDALVQIVITPEERMGTRAEAAASVLGPVAVGKLVDAKLAVHAEMVKLGRYEKSLSDRYYGLRDRIALAPGPSLVGAIQTRAENATNEDIREMSGLLCRQKEEGERARPFDEAAHFAVGEIVQQWGERLLASGADAARSQMAAVVEVIAHFPSPALLPLLKRLTDEELRRHMEFRRQAEKAHWQGPATNEARTFYDNRYEQAFHAIKSPDTTVLMVAYLPNLQFGANAASVLKAQWLEVHEPKKDKRFLGRVDFSRVEESRVTRGTRPTPTCDEAEAIFAAIEPLLADGSADPQRNHAVLLAVQAARLPHGGRGETIQQLLSIAPQAVRAKLVLSLVLSGEVIPHTVVQTGIKDVFETAKKHAWILSEGWQLKAWLEIVPFTDYPESLADTIIALPPQQRAPYFVEEMVRACEHTLNPGIEQLLFKLAENDPRFYADHAWREAARRLGSLTSARRYLDFVLEGKIDSSDDWRTSQEIAGLMCAHAELRELVYGLLRDGTPQKADLLARAIAESDDPDGLLVLVELESKLGRPLISWRTIQSSVTEHVPSETWKGAFDVLPIAATEMRKRLLAITTDGGPHDAAARVLREIDRVREDYGTPEGEPRHPDLASGRPWPILVPDPDADDEG